MIKICFMVGPILLHISCFNRFLDKSTLQVESFTKKLNCAANALLSEITLGHVSTAFRGVKKINEREVVLVLKNRHFKYDSDLDLIFEFKSNHSCHRERDDVRDDGHAQRVQEDLLHQVKVEEGNVGCWHAEMTKLLHAF